MTELRRAIENLLDPLIPEGARVALVDIPDHSNVGDSAIWLGERAYLAARRANVVYQCDRDTLSESTLRTQIKDGVILLHGGGNFGTLWPRHQAFRERVIQAFPNNRIIQLPQSIYFDNEAAVDACAKVIRRHGGVTILTRDPKSLEIASSGFASKNLLCPDMAFCLGTLACPTAPSVDLLVQARTDKEAKHDRGTIAVGRDLTVLVVDWLDEDAGFLQRLDNAIKRRLHRSSEADAFLLPALRFIWLRLARRRLGRGLRLLTRGRVVISDRLHGHILCVLCGVPHVIVDNSYGKIRAFYDQWTSSLDTCAWAESLLEAESIARRFLGHGNH